MASVSLSVRVPTALRWDRPGSTPLGLGWPGEEKDGIKKDRGEEHAKGGDSKHPAKDRLPQCPPHFRSSALRENQG